jgi:hypothetical protein
VIVMVSNATGIEVGLLAGQYPGRIGHLFSPGGQRGPWRELPYALDNGAWGAHLNDAAWSESKWRHLMMWAAMSGVPPLWAVVPDVVADREATLANWALFSPIVREFGFRPAFAVQDEMIFADVPDDDCVLFLGGSTPWKLKAIDPWCAEFPGRVHVARVNTWGRLVKCWRAGAISVDGTGWFHKSGNQANDLRKFLRETSAAGAPREEQRAW